MLRFICFLVLLGALFLQAAPPHDFHFTKCQIEYSSEQQSLQITMHLFIDDVELALEQRGHKELFLCSEKETETATTHLLEYLQASFQLSINDSLSHYQFIGKEPSEDLSGMWCYFEIPNIEQLHSLEVKNSVLTEIYDDQKNVVQVKGPAGKKDYFLLNKQKKKQYIEFLSRD